MLIVWSEFCVAVLAVGGDGDDDDGGEDEGQRDGQVAEEVEGAVEAAAGAVGVGGAGGLLGEGGRGCGDERGCEGELAEYAQRLCLAVRRFWALLAFVTPMSENPDMGHPVVLGGGRLVLAPRVGLVDLRRGYFYDERAADVAGLCWAPLDPVYPPAA